MHHKKYLPLQIIEMMIGVMISSCGLALMIKSSLGQTAITAFTQNITMITEMKSGTILTIFFLLCTFLQILILKARFEKIQLLQVVIALLQGKVVNLICYEVPTLQTINPTSYVGQWLFVITGILLASFGVAMLFKAECIRNPFEELVMVLSNKFHIKFSKLRVGMDVSFMILSFLMIMIFQLDFTTMREGTWFSMLFMGLSMNITFPMAEKLSIYCHMKKKTQTI